MGFLTFLPHPTCQWGCPTPEPHLGQAHCGYFRLGGTEGATLVQVHEAAVTEAFSVVGALSSIYLWGQSSHQLSGGILALPRPQRSKKRSLR